MPWPSLFKAPCKRIFVYVDGFNFYYGCVKGTPYRWLNVPAFIRGHLPASNVVDTVKFFTARVRPRPGDPNQLDRQLLYWRALRTLPEMRIVEGQFLSKPTRMPLDPPPSTGPKTARVMKTEEKGSDVNFATHLLCDAYENAFDVAIVVTNDSDLAEPVRVVRQKLKKPVVILNPHLRSPSFRLGRFAGKIEPIREPLLASCVLPNTMSDARGRFHRPPGWVCSCCRADTTGDWARDCQCYSSANPRCACPSGKCFKHCGCGAPMPR